MGDLAVDSAVEPVDEGRYVARLSKAWEIWGPMGGYVAAVALRAAGAESPFERPASFSCHYLGVAAFDEVQIVVVPQRLGRGAASQRVSMTQGDRAIMEAIVWSIPETEGLEHDVSALPDGVSGPDAYKSTEELREPDDPKPPFHFWDNFEQRPLRYIRHWPPSEPIDPVWRSWLRFLEWQPGADPWLAAARVVMLADLPSWPSGHGPHVHKDHRFFAPTLDLQVSLNRLVPDEPWLLLEGTSPVAAEGLMGFTSRLWTPAGELVAAGAGQTLFRRAAG